MVFAAGDDAIKGADITQLHANASNNMQRWSANIRELLFTAEFCRKLDWKPSRRAGSNSLWGSKLFFQITRPSDDVFASQTELVRFYARQRADRAAEILSQLGSLSDYFAMLLGLTAARNPHTLELIGITQLLSGLAVMMPKHMLASRRPDEFDARIMPIIPSPGHSSFPSGHATQAFAIATVLSDLIRRQSHHFPDDQKRIELLYRQAHRIAVNRTVAGVHFPVDSWAGAVLGCQIGRIIVLAATGGGTTEPVTMQIRDNTNPDFLMENFRHLYLDQLRPRTLRKRSKDGVTVVFNTASSAAVSVSKSELFAWLWGECEYEFAVPHVNH